MIEDMEESKNAFEQRDEYRFKLSALKERFDKDKYSHDTELKDLQRMILHDEKLKNFMVIKSNDRENFRSFEEAKRKIQTTESEPLKSEKELIQIYEDAFEQIKAVTNEDNLEIIIQNYTLYEDKNFALFKLVEELNSEIELLRQQSNKFKYRKNLLNNEDIIINYERKNDIKLLKSELIEINKGIEQVKKKSNEINIQFDHLKQEIEYLFNVCECDKTILNELLDSDGINQSNIMIYLGILEQRINEIISLTLHYDQKDILFKSIKQNQSFLPLHEKFNNKKQSVIILPSISW